MLDLSSLAVCCVTAGRKGALEAITLIQDNFATAPQHPSAAYWNYFQAMAEQRLGNNYLAIELANESLLAQPALGYSYYLLANAFCMNQQSEAVRQRLKMHNPSILL